MGIKSDNRIVLRRKKNNKDNFISKIDEEPYNILFMPEVPSDSIHREPLYPMSKKIFERLVNNCEKFRDGDVFQDIIIEEYPFIKNYKEYTISLPDKKNLDDYPWITISMNVDIFQPSDNITLSLQVLQKFARIYDNGENNDPDIPEEEKKIFRDFLDWLLNI